VAEFRITRRDGSEDIVSAQRVLRVGDDLQFSEPHRASWRTVAAIPYAEVTDISRQVTEYQVVRRWVPVACPAPIGDDFRPAAFP
jgi:hypothetical protein